MPSPPSDPSRRGSLPRLQRRDLLRGVAAGGLVLAVGAGASACSSSDPGAGSDTAPDDSPDERLVVRARAQIATTAATVAATATARPSLAPSLALWAPLHAAHLRLLDQAGAENDSPAASPAPGPGATRPGAESVPRRPQVALTRALTQEAQLRDALAGQALAAESGALARVLAGMSAALSQALAVQR